MTTKKRVFRVYDQLSRKYLSNHGGWDSFSAQGKIWRQRHGALQAMFRTAGSQGSKVSLILKEYALTEVTGAKDEEGTQGPAYDHSSYQAAGRRCCPVSELSESEAKDELCRAMDLLNRLSTVLQVSVQDCTDEGYGCLR